MQHERFARAVDAGDDDSPSPADVDLIRDLAIVALIRRSAVQLDPAPGARERMRLKLLTELGVAPPPTPVRITPAPVGRSSASARLMVALAAALCLVLSLGAMSLLLSKDALPGDALYGIKRTAESASFGLTFSDDSKGHKHLEFAAARLDELETLAGRYSDPATAPAGSYLTALTDLDTDASAGSRLLIVQGTNGDGTVLNSLRDWSQTQLHRLTALGPHLPELAKQRAATSASLLTGIADRATALSGRLHCYAITSGTSDDVGALPATTDCSTPATAPSAPLAPSSGPTVPNTAALAPPRSTASTEVPGSTPAHNPPPINLPTPTALPPVGPPVFPPVPTDGPQPSELTIPLPLPLGSLPPLLPGLPGLVLGG